ncbi:YqgQ family protein [Ornithinibacillus contaminans]|uniref:YqgQ family protein n=1 Tax=Ornithinibacillus contaminans TaxID=694055 RepID=UPI00064E0CF9|nr:YqgQ family protein [Ornithinibacillus contaminans]
MKTVYDVQQVLKRFGTFIYTGNRLGDLELMQLEIQELYKIGVLDAEEFKLALLVLRQEMAKLNRGNGEK